MAGADEGRQGLARNADKRLLERYPLVAIQNGHGTPDLPVASADDRRDMGNLEASGLARTDRAAKASKRLQKERGDEVRLQTPGFGPLHLLANLLHLGRPPRLASE